MMVRDGNDTTGEEPWPTIESIDEERDFEAPSPVQLLRYLDESENADEADEDEGYPRILDMPEGIKVDERRVGRAVAQWVLQVRCDCGRRWFEVEEVDTATCPRCGILVYVDMDARCKQP
jgi:hypothetical protein